jgi:SAM-dependent methyltransferase
MDETGASRMTWEEAVLWLRGQPDQGELVRACYYDDPLVEAARRFAHSEEWTAARRLFAPLQGGRALDLGAGRGIGSYALAADGWQVLAVEPDPSPVVGAAAVRGLAGQAGLAIDVLGPSGEELPVADDSIDLVYCRAVLHHARDLGLLCREVARVLKRGGRFVATRETVIRKPEDLPVFLENHPLHRLYGGENARLLDDYRAAITESGLRLLRTMGPYDSVINYFPMSRAEWRATCSRLLPRWLGRRGRMMLASPRHAVGRWLLTCLAAHLSRIEGRPGCLYSFVARK